MLASVAAMMGSSESTGTAPPLALNFRPSNNTYYAPPTIRSACKLKGRVAKNQQQRRKDQRRAHAAGKRNAFA